MGQTRIIRKYVNRRLYDTTESRYVNLEDLRRLILEGHEIRVTDRASGNDITTPVLLQIIGDSQREGRAIFQPRLLCELIRLQAGEDDPALAVRLDAAFREALRPPRTHESTLAAGQ